jgi:integrase/recombinase XerD
VTPATPARGPDRIGAEVARYLDHLRVERGLAPDTVSAYRRDLGRYGVYLDARGIGRVVEVTSDDVERFTVWLRTDGAPADAAYAPSSIARAVVAVRGFHRYLAREGRAADVAADAAVPSVGRSLPKALPVATVERLLAAPAGEDARAVRDRAMLELLYGAGLRIGELVAVDVDDLDPTERLVRVRGKGGKDRVVPYGEPAQRALDRWLVVRRGVGPRVPALVLNARAGRLSRQGAWKIVRGHAARIGLDAAVSPHTLRHCFATHLLDGGADVRAVQELLGHASVTTTQIYTLVSRSALRQAYEQAHPRAHRSTDR